MADDCDVEVLAHEALEGEGWADGLCPKCLENLPNLDAEQQDAADLGDALEDDYDPHLGISTDKVAAADHYYTEMKDREVCP